MFSAFRLWQLGLDLKSNRVSIGIILYLLDKMFSAW
jgi:hypothetical protein